MNNELSWTIKEIFPNSKQPAKNRVILKVLLPPDKLDHVYGYLKLKEEVNLN
jgi:hypothetical protein